MDQNDFPYSSLCFAIAYLSLAFLALIYWISGWEVWKKSPRWEYGTCGIEGSEEDRRPARRDKLSGRVQFVLWKAGEQGHANDYWHDFDSSHWRHFKPYAR